MAILDMLIDAKRAANSQTVKHACLKLTCPIFVEKHRVYDIQADRLAGHQFKPVRRWYPGAWAGLTVQVQGCVLAKLSPRPGPATLLTRYTSAGVAGHAESGADVPGCVVVWVHERGGYMGACTGG